MHVIRAATQNIWRFHGDWPARREVLRDGFAALGADVVGFQEAVLGDGYDQTLDVLGPDYEIVHQEARDADGAGVSIASRWPVRATHELGGGTPRAERHGYSAGTLAAEIEAPFGRLLFVNVPTSYQLDWELDRERQVVDAARLVEELEPDHTILGGDLNATPEAASIRFLRGLQSLDGTSVAYLDAWEAAHPGEPGHTFTPENPTMRTGETGAWALEPGRRIDYLFVRCSDHGPTLDVRSCERLFDAPVDGAWASDHFGVTAALATHLPDGRPVP